MCSVYYIQSILGQELSQSEDLLLFPNIYKHGAHVLRCYAEAIVMLRTKNMRNLLSHLDVYIVRLEAK